MTHTFEIDLDLPQKYGTGRLRRVAYWGPTACRAFDAPLRAHLHYLARSDGRSAPAEPPYNVAKGTTRDVHPIGV
jgi:hypothetical protein